MKLLLPAALLTIASATVYSAPVSVTCGAPLGSTLTSESASAASCTSFTNGYSSWEGAATASANVALVIAANAADFSSLCTHQSADAQQGRPQSPNDLFGPAAETSILISYSSTLWTSGSGRPGYLQMEGYGFGGPFHDGGATMASGIVGSGSPYQTEITCYSNSSYCTPGTAYYTHNSLIPVTLGTAFTIEANGGTTNWAAAFGAFSGGYLTTAYNFRFLEADGVTPVAVNQAPEPVTVGLVGLAFGALGLVRKARVRPQR